MKLLFALAPLAAALPMAAAAHPDHSHERLTLWHALTEPDHAAMIALGLVIVGLLVAKSRRSRREAARKQDTDRR